MSQPILSRSSVFSLAAEIMAFLAKCGGPYVEENGEVERNVIRGLVTGQYVLIGDDEIKGFASYWKIRPEDLPRVEKNETPDNTTTGTTMYVSEFGVNGCMGEMVKRLRAEGKGMQGLYEHRWKRGFRAFPNQKGE